MRAFFYSSFFFLVFAPFASLWQVLTSYGTYFGPNRIGIKSISFWFDTERIIISLSSFFVVTTLGLFSKRRKIPNDSIFETNTN